MLYHPSDGVSSQPTVPSSSSGAVSSRQTGRSTSNEEPHWFVDVIDKHQVTKKIRLKVKDVHNLDKGLRIIVEFDEYDAAIGKSAGLIAGILCTFLLALRNGNPCPNLFWTVFLMI